MQHGHVDGAELQPDVSDELGRGVVAADVVRACEICRGDETDCLAIDDAVVADGLLSLGSTASTAAFAEASPISRHWRDANTGASHAMLHANLNLEVFGDSLLGIDYAMTMV